MSNHRLTKQTLLQKKVGTLGCESKFLDIVGSDHCCLIPEIEMTITTLENLSGNQVQKQARARFWSLSFLWIYEDISCFYTGFLSIKVEIRMTITGNIFNVFFFPWFQFSTSSHINCCIREESYLTDRDKNDNYTNMFQLYNLVAFYSHHSGSKQGHLSPKMGFQKCVEKDNGICQLQRLRARY